RPLPRRVGRTGALRHRTAGGGRSRVAGAPAPRAGRRPPADRHRPGRLSPALDPRLAPPLPAAPRGRPCGGLRDPPVVAPWGLAPLFRGRAPDLLGKGTSNQGAANRCARPHGATADPKRPPIRGGRGVSAAPVAPEPSSARAPRRGRRGGGGPWRRGSAPPGTVRRWRGWSPGRAGRGGGGAAPPRGRWD